MGAGRTFRRRIGWGASGLMLAAAAVGMSVPSASAVTSPDGMLSLDASPPPGGYVVGVQAAIGGMVVGSLFDTPQARVVFSDNGTCFNSHYPGMDAAGLSVWWTPTTAGTHTISLTQYGKTVSETVTVNPAPDGTPVPTPETPGCQGGGSIDSGSLGF
ncbi:hypothetical protein [Rhodococcus sp. NPDC127528]|uniref:hypothetical protein n=1 Tax=unclassified Rhodococcus (in: high G+C Gram-positive bacteria) TaxID=192944 RepID=UPI0036281B42